MVAIPQEKRSDLQGYGTEYIPRGKMPPGSSVKIRQPVPITAEDIERQPFKYVALALVHLQREMANLRKALEDRSRPVDEYRPQAITSESTALVQLPPQWESREMITSILITGPAGACVVQLGDRIWTLTIPAAGYIAISPVAIMLERNDIRQISSATAGDYTLELMGYADMRAGSGLV